MKLNSPVALAFGGFLAMTAAMGIGRFVYTPILPVMVDALGWSKIDAGLVASLNFLGYLSGASAIGAKVFSSNPRRWLLTALAVSAATTAGMALTSHLFPMMALRFIGGIASAFVIVCASTLVLERLAGSGRAKLATIHFAGVGAGMIVSAIIVAALTATGAGWRILWAASGFAALVAAAFVAIVWSYFFKDNGIFNYYLAHMGLPTVHWLSSAQTAMPSIVFMDVWKNTGFFMVIFIAALQGVPKAITEAAIMDGTPPWRRFWRITLPWISPVVFFAVVYASIGALQVYESIWILTNGGPGDATRSMSINIVEQAFGSFQIGYGASVAVVMTMVILIITGAQLLISRRLVRY